MRFRRSAVPDAVRSLATDERRLAWGLTDSGLPLVATASSLYVGDERLPWTRVERVVWRPSTLTLIETSEVEGAGRTRSWELVEDGRLAETVRTRVTSSIGWSDRRALQPKGAVRLVGRRVPGEDLLEWQLVFEQGTDPRDPALRAQAEQMLDGLRRTIG
ncbi:MAG: hypothetical protein JWM02_3248 [Frankiales bacterium]|nr:hypothetical protein [Frankiales bacterium]